jgi:hypothetical protein
MAMQKKVNELCTYKPEPFYITTLIVSKMKNLTRNELKNVMGGLADDGESGGGPQVMRGICSGTCGEWTYGSPVWYRVCWDDIDAYCSTGAGFCLTS